MVNTNRTNLFDTIPASDLEAELDVKWLYAGGEDPIAYINKDAACSPPLHLMMKYISLQKLGMGYWTGDGIFEVVEGTPIER